jgi:Polysaccharide lyase
MPQVPSLAHPLRFRDCPPFPENTGAEAPPEPTGKIVFSGNWDAGDISEWAGAQCANYGVASNSHAVRGDLSIVTAPEPVAHGTYAARFDLPPATINNACEVLRVRSLALDTDDWYALEVYFPSNWQEPSSQYWGLVFAQFNYENLGGSAAPLALDAHADHVNLGIETGLCNESTGACQYTTGNDAGPNPDEQGTLGYTLRIVPLGTALAGKWQQFIVHVHWAADASGVVEGWWRPRGGTWSKTVSWSGHPTVQWTTRQPAEANLGTHDKIGAYRGSSTFPITLWQGGFCVAISFTAAAACL